MDTSKQVTYCEVIKLVTERIIDEQTKKGFRKYNFEDEDDNKVVRENDIYNYMEYAAKERFKKTLEFLHMTKQTTYQHIFTDITYIIALYYDLSTNSDLTPILRKLIKEKYNKLDVNKLTSFFIPFYNIENWKTLKNANKNETKNLKEFLHEHEETFSLFIKLWNLNIRCYEKDLTKLCTSFYYHENLPSKRKYQKILDAYEK